MLWCQIKENVLPFNLLRHVLQYGSCDKNLIHLFVHTNEAEKFITPSHHLVWQHRKPLSR